MLSTGPQTGRATIRRQTGVNCWYMEFEFDIDDDVYERVKVMAEAEGVTPEALIVRFLTQYAESLPKENAENPPAE